MSTQLKQISYGMQPYRENIKKSGNYIGSGCVFTHFAGASIGHFDRPGEIPGH